MADVLDRIISWECGEMEAEEDVLDFFQGLIDSGMAWMLQGSYGRMAATLIEAGHCSLGEPLISGDKS